MTWHDQLEAARAVLRSARHVFVMSGAGLSAESGVATFRGPGGLWRNHRPEDLATPEAFARDPATVWAWYSERRAQLLSVAPHEGHRALARFVEAAGERATCVTQNVDDLLERAGARRVLHLHGKIFEVRCAVDCSPSREDRRVPWPHPHACAACGAPERPAVVWFGESLDQEVVDQTVDAADRADVALIIGTSAAVFPAAGFAARVGAQGGRVIEVNPEPSPLSGEGGLALRGGAAEVLPPLLAPA